MEVSPPGRKPLAAWAPAGSGRRDRNERRLARALGVESKIERDGRGFVFVHGGPARKRVARCPIRTQSLVKGRLWRRTRRWRRAVT